MTNPVTPAAAEINEKIRAAEKLLVELRNENADDGEVRAVEQLLAELHQEKVDIAEVIPASRSSMYPYGIYEPDAPTSACSPHRESSDGLTEE